MNYLKTALTILVSATCLSPLWADTQSPATQENQSGLQSHPAPTDSIHATDLDEIQIEAPRVIRKADMDIYHPSETAVRNSSDGLQLLSYLSIPSVVVNEVMESVTAAGSSVQIRINGREASVQQVRNLLPSTIKRVEWLDNPGLRYNGANYVLNIIVSNPDAGGSLMIAAQPMLNVLFGNYNASLKLNNGRSQWEIDAYFKPCESNNVHRDYYEAFTFPDGQMLTRRETPLGGKIKNYQGLGSVSYSYIKPDTTIFYARLYAWSDLDNLQRYDGLLSLSNGEEDINLINQSGNKGITPSLSLYLEQHFKRNQTLVVDFSSSLFTGHSFTDYLESHPSNPEYITDIHTYIKDLNQAYALEADYIKAWNKSKLTAGVNYSANRNRSIYRNLDNAVFHQRQDRLYFFAEYMQRFGKFTATAGLGAQYTSFLFKETDQGSTSWNLRPQFTLTYAPNQFHQFRLNFTSWQTAPSLSETNITPQQTDGFQWNIGNPDLKTYNNYQLNLRYSFGHKIISANVLISAGTSPNAIAPYLFWEDDKLITSYENSHGKQFLSFQISPQINVIPKWLMISGSLQYLNERTSGKGYRLYNHNWNGNVQAILSHWNFSLMVQYGKAPRRLWGETISWGEDMSAIVLAYKWKNWDFAGVVFMPFSDYDQGSKMISKYERNEYHLRLDFRMVGLVVKYNLQWGRQKRNVAKLIENEATADKSSAKSR